MRYHLLDGFRGFFLVFMTVNHMNTELGTILGKLNHLSFGWVEDAQGFVFISGLVVGLVYGRIYIKRSYHDMRSAIYRRIRTIYLYQFALIVGLAICAVLLTGHERLPASLQPYLDLPVHFTTAALFLITGPEHMGILAMYIWFMFVTPLIIALLHRGFCLPVLVLSVSTWFVAQLGLLELIMHVAQMAVSPADTPLRLGLHFNVFAWQILFFLGIFIGLRLANNQLDLSFLKARALWPSIAILFAVFIILGVYDRIIFNELVSLAYSQQMLLAVNRGDFSLIYLVAFLVDLLLITWLLVAGPTVPSRLLRWLARMAHRVFSHPALVFLGQHSLQVFSWHIVLFYIAVIGLNGQEPTEVTGTLLLLASIASLYIPAYIHDRRVSSRKARAFALSRR
ncbi:OpgC family protein [Loktanella agnita]|uniref:OpgC family protein n=1 Tax=Loktanella agnita TaxID=287097 RepID=UPI003987D7E8